jgi:hypothetical protein
MDAYLTIAGAEYVVGYDYKITADAVAEQGPSYASGGEPASPMEYEVAFIDLRKDDGGGKETPVDCPAWLKAEIENWLYEDPDGQIYAAIAEDASNENQHADDLRDEREEARRIWGAEE